MDLYQPRANYKSGCFVNLGEHYDQTVTRPGNKGRPITDVEKLRRRQHAIRRQPTQRTAYRSGEVRGICRTDAEYIKLWCIVIDDKHRSQNSPVRYIEQYGSLHKRANCHLCWSA